MLQILVQINNAFIIQVRRKEALPENLSKPKSISTILAIRVPEEDAEIDRLSTIFKIYGKIQQMRVLSPEKKVPAYLLVRCEFYSSFSY